MAGTATGCHCVELVIATMPAGAVRLWREAVALPLRASRVLAAAAAAVAVQAASWRRAWRPSCESLGGQWV